MSNLSVFNFKSSNIRFENRDGRVWVNLTDMAKASGKLIGHWNQLNSTKEFLTEFEESIGKGIDQIIYSNESQGSNETRGTWAVEEVALEFAGWCSVKFKIWIMTQIKTLMKQGYVALPQVQQPQLPSEEKAVKVAHAVLEIQNLLSDNPRLAQFLTDYAISDIMPASNSLTGFKLKGVVEIAEEMGFKINSSNHSQLNRFVKKACGELAKQEERLVNGTMRAVACYPADSEEVKQAITNFFSR